MRINIFLTSPNFRNNSFSISQNIQQNIENGVCVLFCTSLVYVESYRYHFKTLGLKFISEIVIFFSIFFRSKDVHLQDFPTIITLRHTHNHLLTAASALQYRNPNKEAKETYIKMFKAGMTPGNAYHRFTEELQEIHGDDFHIISADRAFNPDKPWVYNLYYKIFRNEYGEASGESMMTSLDTFINKYNDEQKGIFIKSDIREDGNYIIVAVTPLMRRIMNNILEAGEILFCDATSYVDRFGTKTFQILTNSCCGGLPVAVLLTSSEDEHSFIRCLEIFKDFIEDNAFGGRGKQGAKVIMTDDDRVEQNGFSKVFPQMEQLLCTFHILQSCWRYLCSAKSGLLLNNRQDIFFNIKKLLYAETEKDYESIYLNLLSMELVKANNNLHRYLSRLNERKNKWALCFRKDKILRGQNTNNISEAAVRVLKDRILQRTKAYSVVQLLDFLISDMNNYYIRKIVSIANGRIPPYLSSKYTFDEEKLKHLKVTETSSLSFQVDNQKSGNSYIVDLQLDLCTCFVGRGGQICKHIQKVSLLCKKDIRLCPPKTENEREKLLFIAMGNVEIPDQWFQPLQPSTSIVSETSVAVASPESVEENFSKCEEVARKDDFPNMDVENTVTEIEGISKHLIEIVRNEEEMLVPMQKFVKNFHNLKTKSALQSALATFGKYSGLKSNTTSNSKMRLCSSKTIGVQPSAYIRRKSKFGGRSSQQPGRPPKKARLSEHAYAVEKRSNSLMPKKKTKQKAPHSLVACTHANISLGKSH